MIKVLPNYKILSTTNLAPFQKSAQKQLPILFLSQFESRKVINQKINSFKSSIKKNLTREQRIIKDEYSNFDLMNNLYTSNIFIHANKGYTDSILDCICVLLNNQKDAYLLHLAPEKHQNPRDVYYMQKQISSFISDLSKNDQKCSATLFGGQEKKSKELYCNINEVLREKNINPKEILFDKNNNPHSFYYDLNEGIVLDNYAFLDLDDIQNEFNRVKNF